MTVPVKLLNAKQLIEALTAVLPFRPGYATIRAMLRSGMPYVTNPAGKKPYFILADVLAWLQARSTSNALVTTKATDAAIIRSRRAPKAS